MQVSEIFCSIQGEGDLVGMPAVFVRVAGCNLRCDWCDTKYAWEANAGRDMSVPEIMAAVEGYSIRYAVLTGGEPMMAKGIRGLAAALDKRSVHITIESNATRPPQGIRCHLASLSPKLQGDHSGLSTDERVDIVQEWLVSYDCQLKFVVAAETDIEAVIDFLDRLDFAVDSKRIFLMPEGATASRVKEKAPMVMELCREHGFRYGQRLHLELFGSGMGR